METTTEAASPALNGDGTSDNLSIGQAAAMLFAKEQKAVEATSVKDQAPVDKVVADTTEQSTETADKAPNPSEAAESTTEETSSEDTDAKKDVLSKEAQDKEARIQEKVQRRVNEEIAKRKGLEDRVAFLETALQEANKPKPATSEPEAPKGTMPLSHINDLPSLEKYAKSAKETIRWAEQQLSRDDLGEGIQFEDKLLTRKDLQRIVWDTKITLEDHIPEREKFLETKKEISEKAYEMFPFLRDPKDPDFQLAVQAYQSNPWLVDRPNADFIVGVQVEGLKALKLKQEVREKIRAERAAKLTSPSNASPSSSATSKPGAATKSLPASKPAGDQAAVSSGTSTGRVPTQTVAKSALEATREKLRAKGAVTASEAAALLQRSEQLRTSR